MITLKQLLEKAGGQSSGKMELIKTSLSKARIFARKELAKYGYALEEVIPDFDRHYKIAQKLAGYGTHQRKDMPVITSKDLDGFINYMEVLGYNVTKKKVRLNMLSASQKQIYFDKGISGIAKFGPEKTRNFLENKTFFLVSSEYFIIDGHHRFLTGLLFDPDMMVHIVYFGVGVEDLLKLALEYSDSIGNKRNQ